LHSFSTPAALRVEVFDKLAIEAVGEKIGFFDIPISQFPVNDKWFKLTNLQVQVGAKKETCGEICLSAFVVGESNSIFLLVIIFLICLFVDR
jgi:hypothetical protein